MAAAPVVAATAKKAPKELPLARGYHTPLHVVPSADTIVSDPMVVQ